MPARSSTPNAESAGPREFESGACFGADFIVGAKRWGGLSRCALLAATLGATPCRARVGLIIDCGEPLKIKRGVDLGACDACMAKQLLDRAQIAA